MEDAKRVVARVLTNSLIAPSGNWTLTARDLRWAKVLLGQYRKADIDEPEIFIQSWARIFSAHSDEVVRTVVDPLGGIASKISWPATVKELNQACNAEASRIAEKTRRDEGIRQQLEEREREESAEQPSAEDVEADLREHHARMAAAHQLTVYKEGQQLSPIDVDWSYAAPRSDMRRGVINGRDGHMSRIADDLAARRARNALRDEIA